MTKHKNKNQEPPQNCSKFTLIDVYDLKALEELLHEGAFSKVHGILVELHIFSDGSHKLIDIREKKLYELKYNFR